MFENENGPKPIDTVELSDDCACPETNGRFNRSAIKRHALKISEETRSGKFTRVSTECYNNVEAAIEAKFREFRREYLAFTGVAVDATPGDSFLTGEGKARLIESFNIWIANEIHRQTKIIRTGKTL
jgi:hypothetical protein